MRTSALAGRQRWAVRLDVAIEAKLKELGYGE